MIKIAPSILAADFSNLKSEIQKIEKSACMLHIDVMDGHFVPNISIGVPIINSIRPHSNLIFDTHLMISRPQDYIKVFAKAGCDLISFHVESDCDVAKTIDLIHAVGLKAALALKPATPAKEVFPYLPNLDMVLVMTVEPGFGGQAFMEDMLPKITEIREYANEIKPDLDIQVDGGINLDTAKKVLLAGANVLVAGSFVFQSKDPVREVQQLSNLY